MRESILAGCPVPACRSASASVTASTIAQADGRVVGDEHEAGWEKPLRVREPGTWRGETEDSHPRFPPVPRRLWSVRTGVKSAPSVKLRRPKAQAALRRRVEAGFFGRGAFGPGWRGGPTLGPVRGPGGTLRGSLLPRRQRKTCFNGSSFVAGASGFNLRVVAVVFAGEALVPWPKAITVRAESKFRWCRGIDRLRGIGFDNRFWD